jgi:glycosyltransferase involved in cell wall biosynthesis
VHIAFDGTTLRPGRTGVGYYTEHLLRHTAAQCRDDRLTVVSNTPIDAKALHDSPFHTHVDSSRLPRLVWMQTRAPRVLRELEVDVAHFTNGMMPFVCPTASVVTIHDVSLASFPQYHPVRRVVLNRPLVRLAARRADAIITVSHAAKRDIVRVYGVDAARVHVVHEAAAPSFTVIGDRARLERVRAQYGLSERFILYVGTIEPRKNLRLLLEAFSRRHHARELPHQLVVAGPYGWLSSDIGPLVEQLRLKDAIRFTGYVPFEDLPALYNLAELFVFPSVYEGFGLPVVEAMACGTPVVTGPVPALLEVAGGAGEHLTELTSEALGEALVALTRDRERREAMSARGLLRASAFSWERTASETLAVYRRALAKAVPAAGDVPATLES